MIYLSFFQAAICQLSVREATLTLRKKQGKDVSSVDHVLIVRTEFISFEFLATRLLRWSLY